MRRGMDGSVVVTPEYKFLEESSYEATPLNEIRDSHGNIEFTKYPVLFRVHKKPGRQIIGFNLGADFVAEHEWGIGEIIGYFGLQTENELGYEGRRNTKVPFGLWFYETDENVLLGFDPYAPSRHPNETEYKPSEETVKWLMDDYESLKLLPNDEKGFVGAWDGGSFGINAKKERYGQTVRELYEAFKRKDGVITFLREPTLAGAFGNAGLTLLIYSRIPSEIKTNAIEADRKKREELALYKRLEEESGVKELLKEHGKDWYALSIGRLDEKGEPLWWLNPEDQDRYNFGWFSTKDLRAWAKDKGKIVRKKERVRKGL
jgi:hypothetical protein